MPDNNIFENGWNHCNAYIFGWIMSDGCLRKEGRNKTAYAVRIVTNDLEIAEWLHSYMCYGNKIYSYNNSHTIKYRNIEAIEYMMQLGLTERKSKTVCFPNVPCKYMSDFIRGYFDGNGSVMLNINAYNSYPRATFTTGSYSFIESLRSELIKVGIQPTGVYEDKRENNHSYSLIVSKRAEFESLFNYIYKNKDCSFYLKRKYEKFLTCLSCKPKYKVTV